MILWRLSIYETAAHHLGKEGRHDNLGRYGLLHVGGHSVRTLNRLMARNSNNKWTAEDDRQLEEMKAAGKSNVAIAGVFKRTTMAVEQRLYLLRLRKRKSEGLSEGLTPNARSQND